VNGGYYVFERSAVASWPSGSYGLEPYWTKLLAEKRVGAYCSQGRLLDIGTPEIYGRAAEVLESYECEESSLR
jgi:NDP-sugar pyrophosphorylase family protein